jgi:hypothetical protein
MPWTLPNTNANTSPKLQQTQSLNFELSWKPAYSGAGVAGSAAPVP